MKEESRRYNLNSNQIHILKLMYKFRFVTGQQLARYKGISRIASNKSLQILLDQEYIAKHFKEEYRLQGKGPRYYLTPKALSYLKKHVLLSGDVVNGMYKNHTISSTFIDHSIDVFEVYLNLRDSYPATFNTFTRSELGDFDYFPHPKPDLYLTRINTLKNSHNDYMLDIFAENRLADTRKRLDTYIEHFESGEWEDETEASYPAILIVCPDSRAERNLQNYLKRVFDNTGIDDLNVLTTTLKALNNNQETTEIWTNVLEPEKLIGL